MNLLLKVLPGIVAVLYLLTGLIYLYKKEFAWALVWISYASANVGLILLEFRR